MTTFVIILISIAVAGVGGGIIYLKRRLKKGDIGIAESKTLKKQKKKTAEVENKKNRIREKHDEIENNIINDPGNDHGVMPVNTKRKHNHTHGRPCGVSCPSYSDD